MRSWGFWVGLGLLGLGVALFCLLIVGELSNWGWT